MKARASRGNGKSMETAEGHIKWVLSGRLGVEGSWFYKKFMDNYSEPETYNHWWVGSFSDEEADPTEA